jgi:maltooligosyltrehalose trehalohydrolase
MSAIVHDSPIGADVLGGHGVRFRVWAPRRKTVEVVVENPDGSRRAALELGALDDGHFSGFFAGLEPGTLYRYYLDGEGPFPDPASRFQPRGPDGPCQVVDPGAFGWTDEAWRGLSPRGQVLYEIHVGTFTPEGTWAAAAERLPDLKDVGITAVELMPVADFPGRFGWGYDGVCLFAPCRLYGEPDDFRRFVDRAHALGLGVLLDVVYNHLGPEGNRLRDFAAEYFNDRHPTEWGAAINFDGPSSGPVREFFIENARAWIHEYHLDGLRFDATQSIHDASPEPIVAEIARVARRHAGRRRLLLLAENEPQDAKLVRSWGLDAVWNDDFHHAARVALTGRREAYFSDYEGTPQELVSALRRGYLFQGQYFPWQKQPRGSPALDLGGPSFVHYLENHDQVANALGRRLPDLGDPGVRRALTALLLLGPATPLLFQGQEWFSSTPFLYFADHPPELAQLVREGRSGFMSQFPSVRETLDRLPDPAKPLTFRRCVLDWAERGRNAAALDLHRDLLAIRREHAAFRGQRFDLLQGAILGEKAFVLRFGTATGDDRLLIVNVAAEDRAAPSAEPLLAPPAGRGWIPLWSSDDPRYGGRGALVPHQRAAAWRLPGAAAFVLAPVKVV